MNPPSLHPFFPPCLYPPLSLSLTFRPFNFHNDEQQSCCNSARSVSVSVSASMSNSKSSISPAYVTSPQLRSWLLHESAYAVACSPCNIPCFSRNDSRQSRGGSHSNVSIDSFTTRFIFELMSFVASANEISFECFVSRRLSHHETPIPLGSMLHAAFLPVLDVLRIHSSRL